jgi:hypothetical protein
MRKDDGHMTKKSFANDGSFYANQYISLTPSGSGYP